MRSGAGRGGHPAVHGVAVRAPSTVRSCIRCTRPVSPSSRPNGVSSRRRPGVIAISSPADRSWATQATTTPPAAATLRTVNGPSTSVSGSPAVQRHPQQLHRAPPLHAHEHGAVGDHGRRGLVAAVVLLGIQQRLQRATGGGDAAGHRLPGDEVQPVGAEIGDGGHDQGAAVGAVRRQRAVAPRVGHPAQERAVGLDDVDVPDEVAVGPLVPGRDEGQLCSVRAPGHVLAVGVARRDLHRFRQRRRCRPRSPRAGRGRTPGSAGRRGTRRRPAGTSAW